MPAWRATFYRVWLAGRAVDLAIDQPCPELDAWLQQQHSDSACFVTACNPGSQLLSDTENLQRLRRLDAELCAARKLALAGRAIPATPDWPPEPARLIAGLSQSEALALGRRHGQDAVLWHAREQTTCLIICAAQPNHATSHNCTMG